jgi:hypothetical protein
LAPSTSRSRTTPRTSSSGISSKAFSYRSASTSASPVRQPVQQFAVARDQLQLPLAPTLFGAVLVGLGGHLVVAELCERIAVGPVQHVDRAIGRDAGDGAESTVADDGQHDIEQRVRHDVSRLTQRGAHLGARVGSGRQLEVPAGVGTAGAPAQGHVMGGQVTVRGVEVDRVEMLQR